MPKQRFRPKFDRLYWISFTVCAVYIVVMTAVSVGSVSMLCFMSAINAILVWVLAAPWFGYVELGEDAVLVKFGFFLKRVVPYADIRKMQKVCHWYSESILALKNAMEHVDIRYGACDVVSVSVTDNDALIAAIERRLRKE